MCQLQGFYIRVSVRYKRKLYSVVNIDICT